MAIQNVFDSNSNSDGDSFARGNGARLWNGDLEGRSTKYDVRHFLFVLLYIKVWPIVCGDISYRDRLRRRHFRRSLTPTLHVLANLFQLKFLTVCEQHVCTAELYVGRLIFVQKVSVGTLADCELKPPNPLFWEWVRLVGCLCKQVLLLARMRGHEFL